MRKKALLFRTGTMCMIFIAIVALLMTGCTGKDNRSLSDIPEAMLRTQGDSIALAASFTGDF